MRKALVTLAVAGLVSGLTAAPALAGPGLPSVPKDCHDVNELLHIDNVRDCDNS